MAWCGCRGGAVRCRDHSQHRPRMLVPCRSMSFVALSLSLCIRRPPPVQCIVARSVLERALLGTSCPELLQCTRGFGTLALSRTEACQPCHPACAASFCEIQTAWEFSYLGFLPLSFVCLGGADATVATAHTHARTQTIDAFKENPSQGLCIFRYTYI